MPLKKKIKVVVIFGTRPEAIKLSSVISQLHAQNNHFDTRVCVTAQHREMLDSVLDIFNISPDYDLDIMKEGQSLFDITASVLKKMEYVLEEEKPDVIIVQGDTTTTFAASLAAFYKRVKIAHVEAGLRTYNKFSPYPEEINRCFTSKLADFHFAPTSRSQQNLLKEGIPKESIFITGNTVIDALFYVRDMVLKDPPKIPELENTDFSGKKLILVTGHRRESFGKGFKNICEALKEIALKNNNEAEIVYPVHLNPQVQQPVYSILGDIPNIHLIQPLAYIPFVKLLNDAYLVLTDSGGVQEEAPSFGKPVLVMRDTTERPEGIEAGIVRLVGTNKDNIINETETLLHNKEEYNKMSSVQNPYGSGTAAAVIVHILKESLL